MFRDLFDTAPDAMIVVDRNGRIVRANSQALRLFDYAEEDLRDAPIEILIPERAHTTHQRYRNEYLETPRVRSMGTGQELTGLKRNGEEFPVEIALSPINTPAGQMVVASIRDISDTQRARQALARARYDAFVTQIGQLALAATNLDLAMERTPELAAEALQVEAIAILFRNPQTRVLQVRAAFGLQAGMRNALPTTLAPLGVSHPFTSNQPIIAENCAAYPGQDNISSLADAGFSSAVLVPLIDRGELIGTLLAMSHKPRHFDHDAVHFLQSIASLLGAATQRIRIEEQLSHAQRLEAVGQLTGGIAHDFNNLLTVISGNLQILESELTDRPQSLEVIGSALRAVGRGSELTRKLLAFARRQHLSPSACDPKRLLGELGTMLKRTLGETVALEIACPDDIPAIFADPGQLEAALINLALNARDAMPRGGNLSIVASERHHGSVTTDIELNPGHYIVFTVRDTGFGMSPEVLARAFEPFFTTKELGKGSGLGLSMVYGFVKQSAGHLTADSQLGYGTCIELYLPVAKSAKHQPMASVKKPGSAGHETILVVEDEAEVREIAVKFLRSAGYAVLAAESADAALALIAYQPTIALMFSDVVLGSHMTGVELAHEARRRRPGLPVLLTSGYENAAFDGDVSMAGEFELLQKPYTREDLVTAVWRTLGATELRNNDKV